CSWTQTNHEGELIDAIQGLRGRADGALVNAAAFTHTSFAVRDALLAVRLPFVEVHLSNIFAREPERRRSLLADAAGGRVARVEIESTSVWERLFKELATLGSLVAVGYEAHALTVKDAERLTEGGKPWRWKPTTELVERLRVRKDAGEVAAIKSAAALAGE